MVQLSQARWQFLIGALLAAITCACVAFAALPVPVLAASDQHDQARASNDAPAQHDGADNHDLLGVDDDPDDEELSTASGFITLFGPRAPSRIPATAILTPRLPAQTQLDRPPRA